jgi:hypothetical protein
MLTVVCVKWGTRYGAEYVTRLQRGVQRHLTVSHRFVCLTENPVDGVECEPLPSDLPGWWSKLALFRPGLLPGNKLYLDLDVILTANIDALPALLELHEGLWARDDFSYSRRVPRQDLDDTFRKLLGGPGTVNSSVMLWWGDSCRKVWDEFTPAVMNEVHGDQNFICRTLYPDQLRFIPDELVCSYKYHIRRGQGPAPVVVFHGDPKPPDLRRTDPLRIAWEQ